MKISEAKAEEPTNEAESRSYKQTKLKAEVANK